MTGRPKVDLAAVGGYELGHAEAERENAAELQRLRTRLAWIDALHKPAPEGLHGAVICDDCCADWPCPTNRTKETP